MEHVSRAPQQDLADVRVSALPMGGGIGVWGCPDRSNWNLDILLSCMNFPAVVNALAVGWPQTCVHK
jgi:hypothetical protein